MDMDSLRGGSGPQEGIYWTQEAKREYDESSFPEMRAACIGLYGYRASEEAGVRCADEQHQAEWLYPIVPQDPYQHICTGIQMKVCHRCRMIFPEYYFYITARDHEFNAEGQCICGLHISDVEAQKIAARNAKEASRPGVSVAVQV